jgi:hypothetical protein
VPTHSTETVRDVLAFFLFDFLLFPVPGIEPDRGHQEFFMSDISI